ncbi:MAG: S-methyl-5-thioribose-1-phosphate isomerase [Actinomycetia bacterium]|nr:S-methyl-5-thioribose-1-phosphate isomerase [Actinomycetes bacterium]
MLSSGDRGVAGCHGNRTPTGRPSVAPTRTLDWINDAVEMIDQTLLPQQEVVLRVADVPTMVDAIKRLAVRGAPALGVAGAYAVVLAGRQHDPTGDPTGFRAAIEQVRTARPTAVNLARMTDRVADLAGAGVGAMLAEAHRIRDEEIAASTTMGEVGADLVLELVGNRPVRAMTICNTGGLATVERGTALAVVHTLFERDLLAEAIPVETRPLLQGGRLTTWELQRLGAPHRLIVDSAGPFLLSRGAADVVLIGADRVAANGDTANKIGSFSLSLGARHAGVPFIVVAPESTVDLTTPDGNAIEIEDRGPVEVATFRDTPIAPEGTPGINPAFDVTPVAHIHSLVTDRRVVRFAEGDTLTSTAHLVT